MPSSPLRPCPKCGTLTDSVYCLEHQPPDTVRRDPKTVALYNTWQWKRLRKAQLAQHPWCEECLRANIYTEATDVDHIEPHRGDPVKFYTGRLQSLCHDCHSRKTAQEVNARTRIHSRN